MNQFVPLTLSSFLLFECIITRGCTYEKYILHFSLLMTHCMK